VRARPPVEEVYVREFERDGVTATPEQYAAALARTWQDVRGRKLPERYGGVTGERGFWKSFVDRARYHLDGGSISPDCFERLVAHFRRPESWSVFEDVVPALEELRSRGFRLGVISNWDSSLAPLLDSLGLSHRFDALLISAVEGTGKPGVEIFDRACIRLGVDARDAVHVGDSLEEDYEAARRAGLGALLLDRAGRHPEVGDRLASLEDLPRRVAGIS
jgi:putative hydrolase of the HAD superfamily